MEIEKRIKNLEIEIQTIKTKLFGDDYHVDGGLAGWILDLDDRVNDILATLEAIKEAIK